MPKEIQNMVTDGLLTAGHARSLIDVENIKLAKVIINKNLSVRQSELLSKKTNTSFTNENQNIDPNVKDLQNSLELKTGMKVLIDYNKIILEELLSNIESRSIKQVYS